MIELEGAAFAWETHGEGEPPLLLVHGFTGARGDWDGVAARLAERRRVVTYDHRGHGESSHAPPYSFATLTADLAAVVDRLELAPMHLLGHSMGGVVAQLFALDRPAAVASLILMDTACEPAGGPLRDFLPPLVELGRARGMAAIADRIAEYVPEGDAREEVRRKLGRMDVEAFAALGHELTDHPSLRPRLRELRMPVTVIVGENDAGLRPAADVLAAEIPGAVLEVIAAAGHSPQEDQPDAWIAAVERHLVRVAAVSG